MDVVGRILGGRKDRQSKNKTTEWILVNKRGQVMSTNRTFQVHDSLSQSTTMTFTTVADAIRYIDDVLGGSPYVTPRQWVRR
jgi:glycerol-3-phosphate cytidylyltransferase-like family protein